MSSTKLRGLTADEIDQFASYGSKVRKIAVENFLMSLAGLTDSEARANLRQDMMSYGWNRYTVNAILEGIAKAACDGRRAEVLDRVADNARLLGGKKVAS